MRTFCERATGGPPETLSAADAPKVLAALRPTLRTLLGAITAEQLLAEISREL